jgi:hypothetical protein
MTSQDLPGIRVWGRPVKPVAFGLMLLLATLAWSNAANVGLFANNVWGDVVGVLAAVGAVLFAVGWWGRWQTVAEAAFGVATAVLAARAAALFWLDGPTEQSVYLSVSVAVIAGGSLLLERLDPRGRGDAA